MSNNDITSCGILNITEAIQMNRTLKLLDISENDIHKSREVVIALSDHLKHNNTLQVLRISWNDTNTTYVYAVGINSECYVDNIQPKSWWASNTVHYIHQCNHELDQWPQFDQCLNDTVHKINKLQFDDTEAILLTTLVQGNFDVNTLEIVRSEVSYDAAIVISDFLKANKTLQKLDVSQNVISNEAIKEIIKAIQVNTTLKVLNISSNNLSDDGVAICRCLKHNKGLKILDITGNNITEQGAKIVAEIV